MNYSENTRKELLDYLINVKGFVLEDHTPEEIKRLMEQAAKELGIAGE